MADFIEKQAAIDAVVGILTSGQAQEVQRRIEALPSVQLYVSPLSREAELNECDKISRWARGEADG